MAKCGAKTRNGTPCKKDAMPNGRCYYHGGATPRGIAHPNFKHGKYSKALPDRLVQNYQDAINDPELLSLDAEISLVDARLVDLLSRVDSGESGSLWKTAQAVFFEFRRANASGDQEKMTVALTELNRILNLGVEDYRAWDEIGVAIEQRRRLVDSERKRRSEMEVLISSERQMLLIAGILGVIRDNVSDRKTLTNISSGIRDLIPAGAE